MKNLFSIAEIADKVGVAEHKITYAHRTRRLGDASIRLSGRRIYTEADLHRIAKYFGVQLEINTQYAPPNNDNQP